jgi:hypothetical protein
VALRSTSTHLQAQRYQHDRGYAQLNSLGGTPATTVDGNNTYKLTFTRRS